MSELERNKGVATPVSYEIVKEEAIKRYGGVFDDLETCIGELMCDADFMKLNGQYYTCRLIVDSDKDLDLCDVSLNEDGSVEFHTIHYNGGGSLEEVLESSLKSLEKNS